MESRATLFREIHKNTWLKRVTADQRKIPVGTKKSEKFWVVFCVHDDSEALLEGYTEPRHAATHTPEWTVALQTTLHISHTLVPSENEYEFVIALSSETLRFIASSWEIMQEWVDTLRSKLREMKILSPKENLYSKLPEVRPPLLPTRDPMSPLPETPAIPAAIPGVERVSTNQTSRIFPANAVAAAAPAPSAPQPSASTGGASSAERTASASASASASANRASTSSNSNGTADPPAAEPSDFEAEAGASGSTQPTTSNTLSHNLIKMLYPATKYSQHANDINIDSVIASANESSDDSQSIAVDNFTNDPNNSSAVHANGDADVSSLARTFANNVLSDPSSASSTPKRGQVAAAAATDELAAATDATVFPIYPTPEPLVIPRPQTTRSAASKKSRSKSESSIEPSQIADASATNITIIQVSSTIAEEQTKVGGAQSVDDDHGDTNFTNNVQIIPSNYAQSEEIAITNISIGITDRSIVQQIKSAQPEQMHYEQVFVTQIPATATATASADDPPTDGGPSKELHVNRINLSKPDAGHTSAAGESAGPSTSHTPTVSATITFSTGATSSGSSSEEATTNSSTAPLIAVARPKEVKIKAATEESSASRRPLLTRGLTEAVIVRPSRKDVVRPNALGNQSSTSEFHTSSLQHEIAEQRKRSSSTSDTQRGRNRTNNNNNVQQSNNHANNMNNNSELRRAPAPGMPPFRSPNVDPLRGSGRMSLRQQQVMQLRREISHPGGVRIQLRRKDCLSSIAFVDAFGAAWISGWKQKEHPMLYNALHIGDQIVSIGGVTITNAKEANKTINSSTGQFVEFIIRRVPFGRVYAIRREIERQCLGLIRDGNTATIVDVVPNSLSARHGLPPKAQSCDGLSLTFWVLTEINGRPLNLFFKENEVRDRLNAVGRDISILVQPSDLIAKLKKQLKSLRNYKDYIVQ